MTFKSLTVVSAPTPVTRCVELADLHLHVLTPGGVAFKAVDTFARDRRLSDDVVARLLDAIDAVAVEDPEAARYLCQRLAWVGPRKRFEEAL